MSQVAIDDSLAQLEVYATPAQALVALESGLKGMLESERDRLQAEVDFLREVHDSIGGTGEASSTVAVDTALSGILGGLGFV